MSRLSEYRVRVEEIERQVTEVEAMGLDALRDTADPYSGENSADLLAAEATGLADEIGGCLWQGPYRGEAMELAGRCRAVADRVGPLGWEAATA